jgi:iron transport multicopper oxidase
MVGFKKLITGATLIVSALAETHTFNWTTGWGVRNLDGGADREVITCNGEFPWPDIQVNKGDRVQIYLTNGFDDRNTSMHFHGLFQEGTNQMDGPEMVTQCPIPINETFLYNFTVTQSGSFWYHSHTKAQYMDGMRGTFIIHDDDYPYKKGEDYDEETTITLTEWYHDVTDKLMPAFLNKNNPTGAEPIPQNFLLNNTRNASFEVEANTTYLIRLINIGGFTSYYFFIEDHEFDVIEVDGIPVERNTTDMLYITVAQRYTILLKTKNDTSKNFAIMQIVDDGMLDTIPSDLVLNATSYLSYSEDNEQPEQAYVDSLDDYLDDFYLVPVDKVDLFDEADQVITVDLAMDNLNDGINYAFFNNITFTTPKTPLLLTALAAGELATNEIVYGTNTHSIVLQKDEIVDIVVNNLDTGKHPFHLHGHVFQVIDRAPAQDDDESPVAFDEDDHATFPEYPMMRDTVYVREQSNMVLRFKADNPGVWFFHCHIEWHLEQGLALAFIEAPLEIQNTTSQQLTESHQNACANVGINPLTNAAGNTDFLNLKGQNVQRPDVPSGFTKKGIIAMVFTCLSGILGLAALSAYGLIDIKNLEEKVARDLDIDELVFKDEEEEEESKKEANSNEGSSTTDRR